LSVGCIPSKALLCNAELAHLVNSEAKPLASTSMALSGSTIRFDHAAAFRRSRKVADGRVRGVHFLMKVMKKDDITELTGHGTFLDPRTLRVDLTDGGTETFTFANAIVAAGATIRLGPGHRVVAGADLGPAMGPGCE
jgi:dihydrolipoamide dehydrogenase